MEPDVHYLIVCDDVRTDPNHLLRVDVLGLMAHLRSTAKPAFPLVRPAFCVLAVLTNCQGRGDFVLRILQEATGKIIFRSPSRTVRFSGTLRDAVGIKFRIRNCSFPAAGLYWVECVYSATVIGRQRLWLVA